jgi:hypothetical protein
VLFTKKGRVVNFRDFMKCSQDLFSKLQGSLIKNMVMADELMKVIVNHSTQVVLMTLMT